MRLLLLLIVSLAGLDGCGQPKQVYIDDAYIRTAAAPGRPASGYFTLHGGTAATTLISVHTEVAIKTEMHESMTHGGMAMMKPIDHVALPADATVAFKPGGKHLMIFDLNPGMKVGKTITLVFTFSDGTRLEKEAVLIAPGAAAPYS
ncbi:copper chaperone PCu(A)C [Sphingomonas immobilis]|uniref:Copper chaperone PCu(A)C n=1 Tax=Sphingomonas immobilis TaxID=3063997 RepID=A0ABT8ZYF4_9SPHN|nr:copper chaperone PCu(A)C [Sphingomonas sp. CA1-15]MDO7842607.1 copper chaperone PCu(A)C [Sphingomonas sp. CA1-15]